MPILDLSIDELLTTTRAVRKRLDLARSVEPNVLKECLALAIQAPTPGGLQNWHFVVITDAAQRQALANLYRRGAQASGQEEMLQQVIATAANAEEAARLTAMADVPRYLNAHLHEVPVHVIPVHRWACRQPVRLRAGGCQSFGHPLRTGNAGRPHPGRVYRRHHLQARQP